MEGFQEADQRSPFEITNQAQQNDQNQVDQYKDSNSPQAKHFNYQLEYLDNQDNENTQELVTTFQQSYKKGDHFANIQNQIQEDEDSQEELQETVQFADSEQQPLILQSQSQSQENKQQNITYQEKQDQLDQNQIQLQMQESEKKQGLKKQMKGQQGDNFDTNDSFPGGYSGD